ncbi:regulator of telomere elongation helicase 1 homolog [Harmonia axyridis]|uniref:regulator of telomere elongation helicase 1 homolog n=1 Tax=Harmonia axyridis TaxID=115357 RepID=UPI001E279759|nr:regulator of telomere elongation helicase 1 homolog [Harmonia axyridis]
MVITKINDIDVIFPFEPYDIQKNYMSKVIECLSLERNGILESPTGTGKTLSLLCSTLAWLEAKKAHWQLEQGLMFENKEDDFMKRLQDQLGVKGGMGGKSFLGVPTIIYASRTHTQLTQAVSEMKLTSYNHMKACVIGSREQMCIHSEVVKEQNNQTKIAMCNIKTKTRTCNFYNNLSKKKEDPLIRNTNIVDIEDLVAMGKSHKFCPYFMAKELKSSADIIFMPYNYLLEPRFRKTLGIELANNIIILDEAHNVEKMCEESASLQIKSTDLALAIEEVTAIMKMLTEQPAAFDDESESRDFSPDDLIVLKQVLLDLEKELDAIPLSKNPEGTTFGGTFIFELLAKAGIKCENHQIIIALLEKLVEFLNIAAEEGPFKRKGNALKLMEEALRVIYMDNSVKFKERVDKCYKVHIIVEEPKKKEGSSWFTKSSKDSCRVLSYWCFSPGFGMKMLLDEGVRCCILTSGTLAPLKPLITELEFKNPVHLENPHVVKDTQLCVRIISHGPDNERLSCSYQNRDNENYLRSLGSTIMNMTRLIPNGLLIFFPSYPLMNKCMEYWQKQGIWSGISNLKSIYTEPRDKVSFSNAMTEYYDKIKDPSAKGAIFMGVCRGKISEGLDFADLNGRGVIIVGLPFPPMKDPRVILKKRYLDTCRSSNQEYIGGDKWYTLEACRAVNQAIGRVIRHKNDYGAILLLDERFKNPNIQSQLSLWLRERIKIVQNFGEITRDLRLFYKNAVEQFPLSLNKKATAGLSIQESSANKQVPKSGYNCFQFSSDESGSSKESSSISLHEESSSTNDRLKGYRKRVGAQLGGISKKMKIRLVPNSSTETASADENQAVSDSTKEYIAMVRKAFDANTFKTFVSVLQLYQKNKNIEELKEKLDEIFGSRHNLRYLLQGVEKYVDKDQKDEFKRFWEQYR